MVSVLQQSFFVCLSVCLTEAIDNVNTRVSITCEQSQYVEQIVD